MNKATEVRAEVARQGLANYVYRMAGRVEDQRESHHDLAHELRALSAVLAERAHKGTR